MRSGGLCTLAVLRKNRALPLSNNSNVSVSDSYVIPSIRNPDESRCKMNDEIKVHVVEYGKAETCDALH